MPASIAFSATGVMAAPSNGSSTIASTLSLMKVSTWLIWTFTSLVPSATRRSMSSYCAATSLADWVIEPIHPWSAAGAEKPMTTLSPASSLEPSFACDVPPLVSFSSSFEALLVQPARASTARRATTLVPSLVRVSRSDFMVLLLVQSGDAMAVRSGGAVPRRQPLLEQHGGDDDDALEER